MLNARCGYALSTRMPQTADKQHDLKGPRQDAVHQAATGDTDATAHCIPHDSSNRVQSCCCHLNAWDDCNATSLIQHMQL